MHRHFIIHKPYGYLSQFVYELKRTKKLLGELYDFPEGTMAIGRLDEDSEGLLLLTTDGMVSEIVRNLFRRKVDICEDDDPRLRLFNDLRAPACFAAGVKPFATLEAH